MANKRLDARIPQKHDIEAHWKLATNFIPMAGELIVYDPDEMHDYARFKCGDGDTNVNDLPFIFKIDEIYATKEYVNNAVANITIEVDNTLTKEGYAADAKAVGDMIYPILCGADVYFCFQNDTPTTQFAYASLAEILYLKYDIRPEIYTRVVNELPVNLQPVEMIDDDVYIYLYIVESTGIAYLNMDGTVATVGQVLLESDEYDNGWSTDIESEAKQGVYCVRKASSLIDETLSQSGMAADAKAVGDSIDKLIGDFDALIGPYSDGLAYTLKDDGTYEVSGIGTCTDTDIIIPPIIDGRRVTNIGEDAFRNCSSLTSVTIPDNVTSIGDSAFSGCTSLTSVTIPDSVMEIGNYGFYQCFSLKSATLDDSVTSIGDYAFYQCRSLMSITIGDNVISIGNFAFARCTSLTSIVIPDSVTSIGAHAFSGCDNLEIYCEAKSKPEGWNTDWKPVNRPVVWEAVLDFTSVNKELDKLSDKSIDRVTNYNFNAGSVYNTSFDDNGVYWHTDEVEVEVEASSGEASYFKSATSYNRTPVAAGEGITFEVDNNTIRINNDLSKVAVVDMWADDYAVDIEIDDRGMVWGESFNLMNSDQISIQQGYITQKIPLSAGSNVTFTVDNDNSTVKINSTIDNDLMKFVTYSELKSLRDNSRLIPGMLYRITDYVCTTAQANTRAMNNRFDIIVQALSENTISENASVDYHWVEGVVEGVTFNSSVVGDDTMLIEGSVIPYYYEYIDVVDSEEGVKEYKQTDKFIAYGYLENNDGVTVPVIYKTDEAGVGEEPDPEFEDPDYGDTFYYVGTASVDGVTYDKWRKIEPDGGEESLMWDSVGKAYLYTNIITVAPEDESIQPNVANLPAWGIRYCLDNDTTRFAWAMDGKAIVNLESILSNGQPLTRQPEFDGRSGNDEYYYAWGTQADVDDADVNNFWYSKSEELFSGDEAMTVEGDYDIVEVVELGKGVIYYMKDEHGNECPYDFKNITFIFDEEETFTFADEEGGDVSMGGAVYNNRIEFLRDGATQILNRVAIKSTGEIKDVTLISGVHDRILDVSEISAPVVYRPSGSIEIILD